MVIIGKVVGQRTISQLRLLDFIIALVIGNIIAHPLSDENLGLEGSMITTTVLVVLYLGSIFTILKFPSIRKLVNHSAVTIVKNGEILNEGLKKARISIDMLLEELREEKVDDVKYAPITPAHYQMETEPFDLPRIIIKEGRVVYKELKQIQKDEDWVVYSLKNSYQTEVKNVLLATIDSKDNLKVFLYK